MMVLVGRIKIQLVFEGFSCKCVMGILSDRKFYQRLRMDPELGKLCNLENIISLITLLNHRVLGIA